MSFTDKEMDKMADGKWNVWLFAKLIYFHIGYYRVVAVLIGSALLGYEFNWVVGLASLFLSVGIIDLSNYNFGDEKG